MDPLRSRLQLPHCECYSYHTPLQFDRAHDVSVQALTTFHLFFQSTATRILFYNTTLVDGAKLLSSTGKMNRDIYLRKIVPIGVLFSLSLVLSNYGSSCPSVLFLAPTKPTQNDNSILEVIPILHTNAESFHTSVNTASLFRL
jgi:hypothetical protein